MWGWSQGSYFCLTTMRHFLTGLWWVTKSGFYMTTSDEQLSGWIKKKLQSTSQSQTRTIKRSWSLVVWFPSDPLWLSESSETITSEKYAQQIGKMHQKLQCLQPTLVNIMSPILPHNNAQLHITQSMLQKLNELGSKALPHPPYSPDSLLTN